MAAPLQLLLILTASFLIISTTIATAPPTTTASSPSPPPSQFQDYHPFPQSVFANILADLGFQELSTATVNLTHIPTPITVFAPTDSSLLTCPSCSLRILLQEHSVPGLYPLRLLRKLTFGTKIQTLATNRCLTITSSTTTTATTLFVGGVDISHPDLFNNGLIVIHGLQGFVSHLSPLSCNVERMTSLSFPPPSPTAAAGFFIMRFMLKDAMLRLRVSGYSVLALAMKEKYTELLDLRAMTIFALDDASIFTVGHAYVPDLRFHIVPNRRLMAADLGSLSADTALTTMERGQKLVVTTAGGGGPLAPMRINYVTIKSADLLYNDRIVVHGLSLPFPHIHHPAADSTLGLCQVGRSGSDFTINAGTGLDEMVAPMPGIGSMEKVEDHHGL